MNLLFAAGILILVNTIYYVLIFIYPDEIDKEIDRIYSVFWYIPSYTLIIAIVLIYAHYYYFSVPTKGMFSRISSFASAFFG